jgi:hypothetical protein
MTEAEQDELLTIFRNAPGDFKNLLLGNYGRLPVGWPADWVYRSAFGEDGRGSSGSGRRTYRIFVEYFLKKKASGREVKKMTSEALKALMAYRWPGNVRELENAVERLSIMTSGDTIGVNRSLMPSGIKQRLIANTGTR